MPCTFEQSAALCLDVRFALVPKAISEKVVRRLMKPECLVAATSKRRRYGSYMRASGPAPDNVVNRDVSASVPNATWRTDITEFQTPAGKVYLSPTIDCFDGRVVSWSIDTRPNDAGCRHRQVHRQRRSALGELRSWWPPSVARQTVPNRWGQTGALDIPQGVLVRRRRMRGFLRSPEDRDVRLTRLAIHKHRGVRRCRGCAQPLAQQCANQGFARLPQSCRAPQELGDGCLASPSFARAPRDM
jgi:hypothetical protein